MSEQYVVVYEIIHHNPLTREKAVYGPYDSLGAAQLVANGQWYGKVYRLAHPDECPGCGHPECSTRARQERE